MEICAGCGKQIEMLESSIYSKRPDQDIGLSYHTRCARLAVAPSDALAAAVDEAYRVALLMCSPDEPDNYGPLQREAWDAACDEIKRRITANREKAKAGL